MRDPKKLASKGRYGDTMLAHINPQEAALLKSMGGAGTINPKTGLREFHGMSQYSALQASRQAEIDAATAAAKAKADAEKSAAASRVLTPEQRQANIARDLALSQTRGARPSGQDSQFYQPVFQSQYTNYATTNPLGVSQYGTPMTARSLVDSFYAGLGRYGSGNEVNQVDPGGRQYWENALSSGTLAPQDLAKNFSYAVNAARQNPSDPYGQYYQNQTGYSGMDLGRGYAQQPMQQRQAPFNPYMNQYQTPFSYQQPMQQQMQTPFSYQQPMAQPAVQPNYGPSQAIVGRSSQMRGTPNVMRRAEGGITSLLKKSK